MYKKIVKKIVSNRSENVFFELKIKNNEKNFFGEKNVLGLFQYHPEKHGKRINFSDTLTYLVLLRPKVTKNKKKSSVTQNNGSKVTVKG